MDDGALEDSSDPRRLAEALRPGLLRVSRRLRRETQKDGISQQDAMLLVRIKQTPGTGVSELADFEGVSRPTMSSHVKRLEAAGLIVRTGDDDDRRRCSLAVTAAGSRALDVLRARRNDWLAAHLARLNVADRAALAAAAGPLLQLGLLEP